MLKIIKKIGRVLFCVASFCMVACSTMQKSESNSEASSQDENTYYKIIWLNYDNSLLYMDNKALEGFVPEYKGDVPIKPSSKQFNYTFTGWSPNPVPAYSNATYIAQFEEHVNEYTITWKNYDGSVLKEEKYTYGSVPEYKGDTPLKPEDDEYVYKFDGWFPNISAVESNQTYTAVFNNVSLQKHPLLDKSTGLVTYGLYPQTRISDSSLLSSLNQLGDDSIESNGWYIFGNNYYAKISGAPSSVSGSHTFFDDGTPIVSGETYWFKCEAISWAILSDTNGYYLLSTRLLDVCRTAIDYSSSEMRTWLNEDFFKLAFNQSNRYISKTTIDNSALSTDCDNNDILCGDTEDNVFLPSYKGYTNDAFGFSNSTSSLAARTCKTTEYARCRGAWTSSNTETLDNGLYWTRSPASKTAIWSVYQDGSMVKKIPARISVRPAINVNKVFVLNQGD